MFTGIIEGLGKITSIKPSGWGKRFTIDADFVLEETKVGDSIAVNGACLTATVISGNRFEADVSPETLDKTTFGSIAMGEQVNLERALRLSDRIDGHLVSGHIDGTGHIKQKQAKGNVTIVSFEVPDSVSRYIIQKGSIAVDGVSLTVNSCDGCTFDVSIIPHTGRLTTIGFKSVGAKVNIESDMIGKYVERFLNGDKDQYDENQKPAISMDLLARTGFLNT